MVLNPTPFKILSLSFVSSKLIGLYFGIIFFQLIFLGITEILGSMVYNFHQSWKIWGPHFFTVFSALLPFKDYSYTYIKSLETVSQHWYFVYIIFSISFFLYFTADSFYCCVSEFTNFLFLKLPIFLLFPFRVCVCLKSQTLFCV